MSIYSRKLKFVNFYKCYFPLTCNPEIDTEPSSMGGSDSHLLGFYHLAILT